MKSNIKILCFSLLLSLLMASTVLAADAKKVLVLGIDGLDPKLLQNFVDQGMMPNFKKLMDEGDFRPLTTSMPPQSPVAWATFITGMDSGGHGIYDFIHRSPSSYMPKMSITETKSPDWTVPVGNWVLPLSSGEIHLLRKGKAFWQLLDDEGIPVTVFRIPANFPPTEMGGKSLSGMGTPDIRGTSGMFSYYTENLPAGSSDWGGGEAYPVEVVGNVVKAKLIGPKNTFRREPVTKGDYVMKNSEGEPIYRTPDAEIDFTVYLDLERSAAKIVVQDDMIVLEEGQWSDWIRVDFEMVPFLAGVSATCKFYLKQVEPEFQLYCSPLQINPEEPAMPISTPDKWSNELFEQIGYFYTQELPEDTKALSNGVFDGMEFWRQAQMVYEERRRTLDYFLSEFEEGFLFFYFSSVDQQSHMLWRYVDEGHPGFTPEERLNNSIGMIYREMDEALGTTLNRIDDDTVLIVMSDHGFCPFYWGVNLNTWLLENGYLKLRDPRRQGRYKMFQNVDWSRTRAYALGLNGLYLNLEGREGRGIVPESQYDTLLDQLERDLLAMVDPRNGRNPITLLTRPRRDFHGQYKDDGPDMLVGYNWGYRSSWESPLGEFPKEIFVDNDQAWSGDHCVDYRITPGVLLTNKKITMEQPALYDLTVGVLDEFGLPKLEGMIGQDCLGGEAHRITPSEVDAETRAERQERLRSMGYIN